MAEQARSLRGRRKSRAHRSGGQGGAQVPQNGSGTIPVRANASGRQAPQVGPKNG